MARLFGTDGIRGVANVDLKPTLAYALGRATAHELLGPSGVLVVGQDTRRSGGMFVQAIAAGAASLGADVQLAGTLPTPALAFIAGSGDFGAGIMVSASHNPADDNGLKVLDARGMKLDDDREDALEALIWRAEELVGPRNAGIGRVSGAADLLERYRLQPRWRWPERSRPGPADRPRLRQWRRGRVGAGDPGRDRRRGRRDLQRARRGQHQRRLWGDGPGRPGPGRRSSAGPTLASPSTVTPTGWSWSTATARSSTATS